MAASKHQQGIAQGGSEVSNKVKRYTVMLSTLKPIGIEEAVTGMYHQELHSVVLASDYDALQAECDDLKLQCKELLDEIVILS